MSSKLDSASDKTAQNNIKQAEEELEQLNKFYADIAADVTLTAASMAPPPAGTVADVVSIGKSLWGGDWGGALLDVVGLIPLAGDAIKGVGKGTKIVAKMDEVADALKAARATLARQKKALINGRKNAAKKYWEAIKTKGQKEYDDAIKSCSKQDCILKKGPQYRYTPKTGGSWVGDRGDGVWVPVDGSRLDKALKEFNTKQKPKTNFDGVPYKDGFPNYDNFVYKASDGRPVRVEIPQRGGSKDFAPADKEMKELFGEARPDGYTWHHEPDGVTMTLVPEEIHGFGRSQHSGGTSLNKQPDF
jgi:hypothetical protein